MKGLELAFELNRLRKTKLVGEWLRVIKAFTNNSVSDIPTDCSLIH